MKINYKSLVILSVLFIFVGIVPSFGAQNSIEIPIDSRVQPWKFSDNLNSLYRYGIADGLVPVEISSDDGFAFKPADVLTVQYLSGLVNAASQVPDAFPDANAGGVPWYFTRQGDINYPGTSGKGFPSIFMSSGNYYLMELVGTFADDSGNIVGVPFAIGVGPTDLVIPAGATRLQLGINDDIFADNSGSFQVSITGVALIPEPTKIIIDIKPGSYPNSINPANVGNIPVAIISTQEFHAVEMIDPDSLTFGFTGDEFSLAFCNSRGEDINRDGILDLVCHFVTIDTAFKCGDTAGILKGKTVDGTPIEGSDSVRIVPCKN